MSSHKHKFVKFREHNLDQRPVEAGRPGRLKGKSSFRRQHAHKCIKDISVSSNEHMATRMINQELDMAWVSEKSYEAVRLLDKTNWNNNVSKLFLK